MHHENSTYLFAQILAKQLLLAEPAGSPEASPDRPQMPDTDGQMHPWEQCPSKDNLNFKTKKEHANNKKVANTPVYHNSPHLQLERKLSKAPF